MRTVLRCLAAAALAVVALSLVAGCGGGGAANGSMGLYVMDAFSDEHPQVWATLHRVEVASEGGGWRTVFDDTEGIALNLPELADEASFLGSANLPAARYTRARLTLRNSLTLTDRAGNCADVPLLLGGGNGFASAGSGTCTAEFPIDCPVGAGAESSLAVDFDLPQFEMVGAQIRARIQQGDANRFRAMRKHGRLLGRVTNLEAGVGFDLAQPNGRTVRVALSDATVVASASNGADAVLADGQAVFVTGAWDPDARVLNAAVVLIMDIPIGLPRAAHVRGAVLEVDPDEKTFVVEPANAFMGFRPAAQKVKVATTAQTAFGFVPRAPATFDDVTVGAKVDVVGSLDAQTETITARRVLIGQ